MIHPDINLVVYAYNEDALLSLPPLALTPNVVAQQRNRKRIFPVPVLEYQSLAAKRRQHLVGVAAAE